MDLKPDRGLCILPSYAHVTAWIKGVGQREGLMKVTCNQGEEKRQVIRGEKVKLAYSTQELRLMLKYGTGNPLFSSPTDNFISLCAERTKNTYTAFLDYINLLAPQCDG